MSAKNPTPSTLTNLSYSPSSRAALLMRCHASIVDPKSLLPRSGPWAHHIVCPKKSLPTCIGRFKPSSCIRVIEFWHHVFRTQHKDVWHINEKDRCGLSSSQMSRPEWEDWHARHSIRERTTSTGLDASAFLSNNFLMTLDRFGMACPSSTYEGKHLPTADQELPWKPLFPII